jgi:hypothetical protein
VLSKLLELELELEGSHPPLAEFFSETIVSARAP